MSNKEIEKIFKDEKIIKKIREKLPLLFQLAELDNSRDGKLGMEIGSTRERILIAMLIYQYGEENVKVDIPITEKETDVILFDEPISIKTLTHKKLVGVKLIWTVDAAKAEEFRQNYIPDVDVLLVQINWDAEGAMYLFTEEAQKAVLNEIGRDRYFKLPKAGTNPRGVEISAEAINMLAEQKTTLKIPIKWDRDNDAKFNAYERWVDHWKAE